MSTVHPLKVRKIIGLQTKGYRRAHLETAPGVRPSSAAASTIVETRLGISNATADSTLLRPGRAHSAKEASPNSGAVSRYTRYRLAQNLFLVFALVTMAAGCASSRTTDSRGTGLSENPGRITYGGASVQELQAKTAGGDSNRFGELQIDTKTPPFGPYDRQVVQAIQDRWAQVTDKAGVSYTKPGKVVVTFRLNSDGSVTEVKTIESNVAPELITSCQKAISESAPFQPWPEDMRKVMQADHRDVTFTFYYTME